MYIRDGIAYADELKPAVRISGVRPMKNYRLWVRFNTGEAKIYDFTPLLEAPGFAPLKDVEVFNSVYIDYGVTVWLDGDIDIDPGELYKNGVPADNPQIA